jgi:hypothetical protein
MIVESPGRRSLMFRGGLLCVLMAGVTIAVLDAHKPITSKYTYNDDVFRIFHQRCGACHVGGAIAPMSLMTYKEAFPWAESIRTELIAGTMPPWNAERIGGGGLRNLPPIDARDLDVLLTWAAGGAPEGEPERTPPAVAIAAGWRLGPPDLVLEVPRDVTLAAGETDRVEEFVIPTGLAGERWIRAVDLLPGTAAMVRSAVVRVTAAGDDIKTSDLADERLLTLWVPGHPPIPATDGAAFRLPAGAAITARIHYKKTWSYERQTLTDRSRIGVYFSPASAAIRDVVIESPPLAADRPGPLSFSQSLDRDVQAVAIRPDGIPGIVGVQVDAALPDGTRAPLVRATIRPGWEQRYWFDRPVVLPRGTKLSVVATPGGDELTPPAAGPPPPPLQTSTIRLVLNVIP